MQKVKHLPKRNILRSNYELYSSSFFFKFTIVYPYSVSISTLSTSHVINDIFHQKVYSSPTFGITFTFLTIHLRPSLTIRCRLPTVDFGYALWLRAWLRARP